jgi:uncharacterized protein YndB with AHSA1/START domain
MGELRMERRFRASPERLFSYLTEARNVAGWWGPEGMTVGDHALDLAKPGPWSMVLTDPAGRSMEMSGTVVAVDPPRSVELTMMVPGTGVESTVRFEVVAAGTGSTLTLMQSGISDEMIAWGQRGWVGPLNRLTAMADEGLAAA